MSINPLNTSPNYTADLLKYEATAKEKNWKKQDKKDQGESPAVEYKKNKELVIERSDVEKLLKESREATEAFKKMIVSLVNKQTEKHFVAYKAISTGEGLKDFLANLQVDDETRLKAAKEISEDGYYGVKKTSERILNFAKALSGGDETKIEELRKAVQDGFDAAKRMWGGELPQISKDTYDAVMKGFDEWAASFGNKQ